MSIFCFVVDTNSYAGNFERTTAAFMTEVHGHTHGEQQAWNAKYAYIPGDFIPHVCDHNGGPIMWKQFTRWCRDHIIRIGSVYQEIAEVFLEGGASFGIRFNEYPPDWVQKALFMRAVRYLQSIDPFDCIRTSTVEAKGYRLVTIENG